MSNNFYQLLSNYPQILRFTLKCILPIVGVEKESYALPHPWVSKGCSSYKTIDNLLWVLERFEFQSYYYRLLNTLLSYLPSMFATDVDESKRNT